MEKIKEYAEDNNIKFAENEPMRNHTTFKIGGEAKLVIYIKSIDDITQIMNMCYEESVRFKIVGRGSNLLVSDNGFDGCVLLIDTDFSDVYIVKDDILFAESGASLAKVCNFAMENSLTGMEFAYGIPGNVGGAIYMNAGAYGGEINDILERVNYVNPLGEQMTMPKEEAQLSYRHSVFQNNGCIVTGAYFKLHKSDRERVKEKMEEILSKRRKKQPLEYPSAGSFFKRPDGYFAAKLLEECNLKGYQVGGAQVSEKHAGFIINKGGATADDVLKLSRVCCDTVYKEKGVKLETEVEFLE